MHKVGLFFIFFSILVSACAAPVATLSPTSIPTVTAQPSATATAIPSPTATPEPTSEPGFRAENGKLIGPDGAPVLDPKGNPIEAAQIIARDDGSKTVLGESDQATMLIASDGETYPVTDGRVTVADGSRFTWDGSSWMLKRYYTDQGKHYLWNEAQKAYLLMEGVLLVMSS